MQPDKHETYTEESPNYGIDIRSIKAAVTATVLLLVNIFLMVFMADTWISDLSSLMFEYLIVGVLIFGALLTIGREAALRGLDRNNLPIAFVGVIILLLVYGAFGGMILSYYSEAIWMEAIYYSLGGVIISSIIATLYVLKTDRNLNFLSKYSGIAFIIGIVAALIGTFITQVSMIAFIFFVIGFLINMVWEIWMTTTSKRSPLANGVGIYVAVTGLFVHFLQIALEMLSEA
jgi:FtsH-binding integral membrane protein